MSLWWLIIAALIIIFCVMQWVERPLAYYAPEIQNADGTWLWGVPPTSQTAGGIAYTFGTDIGIAVAGNDGYRYHLANPSSCDHACQTAPLLVVSKEDWPSFPPRWFSSTATTLPGQ